MSVVINGTTGITTPDLIDSNGTANGVAYLNGSKVLTTGSALVFDGTNLGLGVTPSAWGLLKGFDISSSGALFGYTAQAGISNNAYFDGSNWKYKNTAAAAFFRANAGAFEWHNAPSGTAGNAISFTQAMTLDSSGNLGVGATSPGGKLELLQPSVATPSLRLRYNSTSYYFDASMDANGNAVFMVPAANGVTSGNFVLGAGGSERARIDSSGNLLVGATSQAGRITALADSGNNVAAFRSAGAVSSTRFIRFDVNTTTEVGSIQYNGTGTSYVTTSDYRLKENVQPMTGALARVAALKPCTYTWKSTGEADEGFIAHELGEVCSRAVCGEKDAVDADGKPVYQGIDTSFLVATLTAAIQEQQSIIQTLTDRITALEAK